MRELSVEQLQEYLSKFGKRGEAAVESFLKNIENLDAAWGTSYARAILQSDMDRASALMQKAYEDNLPDDERIELRYLKGRLDRLAREFHEMKAKEASIIESLKQSKQEVH